MAFVAPMFSTTPHPYRKGYGRRQAGDTPVEVSSSSPRNMCGASRLVRAVCPKGILIRGAHVVSSGRSVVRDINICQQRFVARLPHGATTVHAEGLCATPGLIDLQINGVCGHEFVEGDLAVAKAQERLPMYGVTSFLPTMGSSPLEKYRPSAVRSVIEKAKKREGAEALGWHLEGPFLNPNQAGIHHCANIVDHLDEPFWRELFRTQAISLITLAPEMPYAGRLLDLLASLHIPAAVGHSMAEESDLLLARQKGALFVSHLFNAMLPFHHRAPGIVGAVLGASAFGCTLISDLYHVYPEAIQIAYKCLPRRLALISDGAPLLGSAEKKGMFLGNPIEAHGERALTMPSGALAGSLVPLHEQMKRFMMVTGSSFPEVVRMVTEVPALFIRKDRRKGKIAVGYDADCVLWENVNSSPQIVATLCRGTIAFAREDFWTRVVHE